METRKTIVGKCPVCKRYIQAIEHIIGKHGPGKTTFFCRGSDTLVKRLKLEIKEVEKMSYSSYKVIKREYQAI